MLVFSRRSQSSVVLTWGSTTVLLALNKRGGQVRFQIIGPAGVRFRREELESDHTEQALKDPGRITRLVLSRKQDEAVTVEGLGTIRLLRAHGRNFRLGFEFPAEVSIQRDDVWLETHGSLPYEDRLEW